MRENCGDAGARDAVQALVPPVVGGNVEARNGRGRVLHLGDFFIESETRDEIVDALIDGERGIEVRSGDLGRGVGWRKRENCEGEKEKGESFHERNCAASGGCGSRFKVLWEMR